MKNNISDDIMWQESICDEIAVVNFAGGGGTDDGIERFTEIMIGAAINHDPAAIRMHKTNHPYTEHFQEDVFAIDPVKVCRGRPVGLAWFSPDCTHFSRAKGGTPVKKEIRGLSWVIVRWAMTVRPRVILMENVKEIRTWGPLIEKNGGLYPDPARKGETFDGFVQIMTTGIAPDHPALLECCEFLHIERDGAEVQRLIADDYIIDHDYTGAEYPKSEQMKKCGNAVCPTLAGLLVAANLPEYARETPLRTLEEWRKAVAV